MKYGLPEDLSLVDSFFLSINDVHNAIKFSTVHQFADDTNLLISNESIKTVQTQINLDLYLVNLHMVFLILIYCTKNSQKKEKYPCGYTSQTIEKKNNKQVPMLAPKVSGKS